MVVALLKKNYLSYLYLITYRKTTKKQLDFISEHYFVHIWMYGYPGRTFPSDFVSLPSNKIQTVTMYLVKKNLVTPYVFREILVVIKICVYLLFHVMSFKITFILSENTPGGFIKNGGCL
jgi:hypothetical protein